MSDHSRKMRRLPHISTALILAAFVMAFPFAGFAFIFAVSPLSPVRTFLALWLPLWLGGTLYSFVLGIVWHNVAINRGWRGVRSYMTAGFIMGATAGSLITTARMFFLGASPSTFVGNLIFYGALVASIMGMVWLIRRPDRDADRDIPSVFE